MNKDFQVEIRESLLYFFKAKRKKNKKLISGVTISNKTKTHCVVKNIRLYEVLRFVFQGSLKLCYLSLCHLTLLKYLNIAFKYYIWVLTRNVDISLKMFSSSLAQEKEEVRRIRQ